MQVRSGLCLLLALLALSLALHGEGEEATEGKLYSNSWAVEVVGGDEVADVIASRHGFTNMGRVSRIPSG